MKRRLSRWQRKSLHGRRNEETAEEISEGKGTDPCEICGRARGGVLRMKKDILAKLEFIIIVAVLIIIVVFGKDIMAAINGAMEVQAESLVDQLLR